MIPISRYISPLGKLLLAADKQGLLGIWFEGQKYFASSLGAEQQEVENAILTQTKQWLDLYFSGKEPHFTPPLHFTGTAFQNEVWELLCSIPYGQTTTYGEIAKRLAAQRGLCRMSAQAVGGAVGRNPISIIVPCHRVLSANGNLTGYAGGLDKKRALLEWERENT